MNDFFKKKCLTKSSTFQSKVLNETVTIRELTIAEAEEFQRLLKKDPSVAVKYAALISMDLDLTDEEIGKISGKIGLPFLQEVFTEIQFIGMSEKERKEYIEKQKEQKEQKKEDNEDQKKH